MIPDLPADHLRANGTHYLPNWDRETAWDIGPRLTCSETDDLAELLRAIGAHGLAESLVNGHALEDEETDDPEHVGIAATYRLRTGWR